MALPDVEWQHDIKFSLNGKEQRISQPSPRARVIDYLHDTANLFGTKLSCGEGGCGACTVVLCNRVRKPSTNNDDHADAPELEYRAVNACLFPLAALDGIAVTTVEGVGSSTNMHEIQKQIAINHGSQCGYCTPGWVMNMYELLQHENPTLTKAQIEEHFDGNLCRCTGYRPILKALHSFAKKPPALAYEGSEEEISSDQEKHEMETGTSPSSSCPHWEDWLVVDKEDIEDARARICEGKCPKAGVCENYEDLEDLIPQQLASCSSTPAPSLPPGFIINFEPRPLSFESSDGCKWYRPISLKHLESILKNEAQKDIRFVGGRTAHGVSKYYNGTAPYNTPDEGKVQVELNYIPELKVVRVSDSQGEAEIGAAVTINALLTFLRSHAATSSVLEELARIVYRVANNQVRNSATWAGNLSLCRDYPNFVSDLAVALIGIGATIITLDSQLQQAKLSVEDFLKKKDFCLVQSMTFSLFPKSQSTTAYVFRCVKVAQRPQNAHSHCNAAVLLKVDQSKNPNACLDVQIAIGGVCKHPARFVKTETYVRGKELTKNTLENALQQLDADLEAIGKSEMLGSQVFRQSVMKSALYKAFLTATSTITDPTVESAAAPLARKVSSGIQAFKPNDATAPVSQPIQKLGADMQATGEAKYTTDADLSKTTLFGAILYSTKAFAQILAIDEGGKAKSITGVIDIVTASDIPGQNDISSGQSMESLFVPINGIVRCVGAPIGVVIATTQQIADEAAAQCSIKYGEVPADKRWTNQGAGAIISLDDAIRSNTSIEGPAVGDEKVAEKLKQCKNRLKGELYLGAQKHFYMEPQVSLVSLSEFGVYEVETSSQFPNFMQQQLAAVLNVHSNSISIKVPRVGGGFGGKLTRCVVNAAAAAVAAHKHKRPVRVLNNRNADFSLVGGREYMKGEYEVGFDDDGNVQAMDLTLRVNCGCSRVDAAGSAQMAVQWSDSAYHTPSFHCRSLLYLTNTQTCTSLRAPGVPQSLVLVEAALDHVARTLNVPLQWVQERNMYKENDVTPFNQKLVDVKLGEVWNRLLATSKLEQRQKDVAVFNTNNKWKKRGIAVTPTKYGMTYSGRRDGTAIDVFASDGTVILWHSGCEIGQGIHTKAAQACAYKLGIPLDMMKVRPTSTDKTPNGEATGGSSTSESVVQSVVACCEELLTLIKPYEKKNDWVGSVKAANDKGVRLFACAQPVHTVEHKDDVFDYFVYAGACSEVEVDILTGEINILSSEIVYDCGISLNPAIDIGQIEGGFLMGIGLYMEEEVAYAPESGELLTNGTWEYKLPCARDIPEKLKVTLLPNDMARRGVLSSKATGEPPYALACSVYFAAKNAIRSSRHERGITDFFHLKIPASVAERQQAAKIDPERDFVL
ncbi:TPA: hypothetical protein N0F65_001190 [Lagenidium giganteum]|uniref:Aldehyde oxidase n=1 Tax=Lagenidium giganteum TaxID=4803 RepID=A0AAV2Z5R7_9STRA|nr:TPA: hypothetical protein N0F65_001190 [Lagenidium giganteum]